MAINLASKYASKVDERLEREELTNIGLNKEYNWDNVDTITIYDVDVAPLNDYKKEGTNRYGEPEELGDNTESYKLTTDKSFTYTIDEFFKRAQMGIKQAGKSLARQLKEVVAPFRDRQRLKVWTDTAVESGQVITATPNKTNTYSSLLDMQEMLDDAKAPSTNRIAYCTPKYFKFLKLDEDFIKKGDLSQKMLVKGQIGEADGIPIVKVPKDRFPEGVNCVLVYTKSTTSPAKLTEYKTHSNPPGINGDLVEGRIMMDTFVLKNKKKTVAIMKEATSA